MNIELIVGLIALVGVLSAAFINRKSDLKVKKTEAKFQLMKNYLDNLLDAKRIFDNYQESTGSKEMGLDELVELKNKSEAVAAGTLFLNYFKLYQDVYKPKYKDIKHILKPEHRVVLDKLIEKISQVQDWRTSIELGAEESVINEKRKLLEIVEKDEKREYHSLSSPSDFKFNLEKFVEERILEISDFITS